ncbi:hypothetical protein [uncultured Methanobacterium sp.]|uniref:hypothetical protein n=1 Tax=uncultured Methanobacterium sp. TaxID=176306 RepID=UPI002AA82B59|nr:hypothetical protein [uncultured Methanobacterium sp.]
MGYLICDKCGGYYELQPGEKPEDFSKECECGGELIYSDTFDVIEENEDVHTGNEGVGGAGNEDVHAEQINDENNEDANVIDDSSTGEELIIKGRSEITEEYKASPSKTVEDYKTSPSKTTEDYKTSPTKTLENYRASSMDKAYVKEIKLATQVQEILETKGHYIIKGNGNSKFIKIIKEGIETDDGQLIRFEDIINIIDILDSTSKPKIGSEKSGLGSLISTGYQIFAPRKVTLKIIHTEGEIELKDVKLSDAKRCVSFLKRRLNKNS